MRHGNNESLVVDLHLAEVEEQVEGQHHGVVVGWLRFALLQRGVRLAQVVAALQHQVDHQGQQWRSSITVSSKILTPQRCVLLQRAQASEKPECPKSER